MYQQWVQVTHFPLLMVIGGKGTYIVIAIVKRFIEAAKQRGHGQVDGGMAKINGRIDQYRPALFIAKEVSAPQIAVQKRGHFSW